MCNHTQEEVGLAIGSRRNTSVQYQVGLHFPMRAGGLDDVVVF